MDGADHAGSVAGPLPSGYRAGWVLFCDWCAAVGEDPLPAATETLVGFLEGLPR